MFKPGIPVKLFEARNITTLASGRFFDVTKDGLQEADGHKYLVLEFVDGITLGDDIARVGAGQGLPLAEALPIAREIIDALEAAHDKGIVA